MRFCVLSSGSKGNAVWVEEGITACLVDNGLPLRQLLFRAGKAGLRVGRLAAIFVTHEHSDHLSGVGPLARHLNIAVYASPRLWEERREDVGHVRYQPVSSGQTVVHGGLRVEAVKSSHDTVDPLAFILRGKDRSLGVATDVGHVTKLMAHHFQKLDSLVLEFNHDLEMLLKGDYPLFLKQRVRGRKGHLSNDQAAEFLASVNHPGLQVVVLAHLSENNNTPELAEKAARNSILKGSGRPRIHVASQHEPSPVFEL